jgi:hypothetical protein
MVKLREPLIVDSVSPLDEKINVGAFTLTFRGLLYLLGTLILAYTFYAKHTPAGYTAALATFTVGLTLVFYPPKSQSIETIIILAAAYLAGTVKAGGKQAVHHRRRERRADQTETQTEEGNQARS